MIRGGSRCSALRAPPIQDTDTVLLAPGVEIPDADIELRYIRSPGPGGQNVNKVATAVQLRFNAAGCSVLDDWTRARLATLAGRRLADSGWIVISAHRHRTQERNRADALERLAEMIMAARLRPTVRRPTKPTKASKRRRLDGKRNDGTKKRLRSRPTED